jgi:hypothetical protein
MTQRDRKYAVAAAIAVLFGIGIGFYMLGSPGRQREIEADRRRVEALQAIANGIHARSDTPLPDTLQLSNLRRDPVTQAPYEYQKLDENRYLLCATFSTDNRADASQPYQQFWLHAAGRQCYNLDRRELN